jgi:hypothetical protein
MSDGSDPHRFSDADVTGPGAASYDNCMNVDVNVNTSRSRTCRPTRSIKHSVDAPAISLSRLFSTIEYANVSVLTDLAKRHNVQLPEKYSEMCCVC